MPELDKILEILSMIGVFLGKTFGNNPSPTTTNSVKTVQDLFGDPMSTTRVTINDVSDWIKSRDTKLNTNTEVAVVKLTKSILKGIKLNNDDGFNYLLIAILDKAKKDNSITDYVLIKYEMIDSKLDILLEKGDGILTIEG